MKKVAIINDTRTTSHYGCMLVMENLLALCKENNLEVIWTWPVSVDWRKHKTTIVNKPKVDAIIVNGEGTIHHNKDRKYAQALIDFASFSNDELNTPSYLINATLHENDSEAYHLLGGYRAIYVRDRGSFEELTKNGVQGRYVPDLTFAKSHTYNNMPREITCVVDSAIKQDAATLKGFAEKNNFPFKSMIVARPGNAKFLRSPRPYVKNFYQWLTGDYKVSTAPQTYIQYLRNYELIITGRYHTVSMCIKNNIPFIAIESNTPKIRYLLQDAIGDTARSIDITKLDRIDVNSYKIFNDSERLNLNNFVVSSEISISAMMSNIAADISDKDNLANYKYD